MNVALITTFFGAHRFGGDAAYVERLAAALLRRGHSVTVFYSRDAFDAVRGRREAIPYQPPTGLRIHALTGSLPRLQLLWMHQTGGLGFHGRALLRHLREQSFDVIHFHNISLVGGAALLRQSPRQSVRLMTAHEHWLTCPLSVLWRYGRESCESATCSRCTLRAGRPPQLWRKTGGIQRAVRDLDALVFPSQHALEAHAIRGIHHARARVLPYFIPDEWSLSAAPVAPAAEAPFRFIGRLVAEKGLQTLLPIFRDRPGIRLEVTGDGPFRPELERLAGGAPNIRFLGAASADRIRAQLQHTRALLVPSLFPETFGYVLLEAWSQGVPTLSSNAGALPEVTARSGGGWVCRTASEFTHWIERLQDAPAIAVRQGLEGWSQSRRQFAESDHIDAWESVVQASAVVAPDARGVACGPVSDLRPPAKPSNP